MKNDIVKEARDCEQLWTYKHSVIIPVNNVNEETSLKMLMIRSENCIGFVNESNIIPPMSGSII